MLTVFLAVVSRLSSLLFLPKCWSGDGVSTDDAVIMLLVRGDERERLRWGEGPGEPLCKISGEQGGGEFRLGGLFALLDLFD